MVNLGQKGIFTGFDSWTHLVRFCIATIVILGLIVCAVSAIVFHVGRDNQLKVSFNKQGSTIISVGGRPSGAMILVPASRLWSNTGVRLASGQTISTTASGLVNLAIHRLVDSADEDTLPRHGWIDPDGEHQRNAKSVDRFREKRRIEPRVGFGCLLAYVRPDGEPNPGKYYPRPPDIQVLGRHGKLTYTDPKGREGILFLVINEAVLQNNPESEKAYVTTQDALDKTYGPEKRSVETMHERWQEIVRQEYWDVWFDDNVGQFLVQVSYEQSRE